MYMLFSYGLSQMAVVTDTIYGTLVVTIIYNNPVRPSLAACIFNSQIPTQEIL